MKHYIIPIFIPHYGCTHACVFCNQQKITGKLAPVTATEITTIIDEHLARITQERYIEVAFYGGSFTALDLTVQCELLLPAYQALKQQRIHAIRLSTRPDCITPSIIQNLIAFGVTIVELGVQSLDDHVLQASQRGHTGFDVVQAARLLKKSGLQCGIQLMPGLPAEDWLSLITTAQGIIHIRPDFVRIYPTLVITHTRLAEMYSAGSYTPLSIRDGVIRAAFLKLLFIQYQIPVIRTGLQATEELDSSDVVLAGPYHPAFGELVDSYLFYMMLAQAMEKITVQQQQADLIIHHHPRDTSKLRGNKNGNIEELKKRYHKIKLTFKEDGQKLDEVIIEFQNISYVINKKMLFHI